MVSGLAESLKNVFIFSRLSSENLRKIAASASVNQYQRGDNVYWEDDDPEALHILLDGKIKLQKQGLSGKDTIVGVVNRGETFGEIAVLDGRPFGAGAQAMEPSEVMLIPRSEFIKMLKTHPKMAFEIILELTRRYREMEESVKGISSERVEQRIVNLLLKFAQKVGERRQGKIRISIYLTRQEIADMVGSTVETTIRVLSRLTKMGLLETKSKIIFLKDVKRLREIAEEGFDL